MRAIADMLICWRQVIFAGMVSRFAGLQSLHPASPRPTTIAQSEAEKSTAQT
ncbi:hypothetical protein I6F15_06275 [Bradyrhizobium sp. BRP14]|nr:hypothetical protein [Bradyrhizobium sp. BRP14]